MSSTIGSNRPNRPNGRVSESVADRISDLLARVDNLRRGSELPTYFTPSAQRRAESIARKDNEMDWSKWSEEEAQRLNSEHQAGWDETLERLANDANEEAAAHEATQEKSWEAACDRMANEFDAEAAGVDRNVSD